LAGVPVYFYIAAHNITAVGSSADPSSSCGFSIPMARKVDSPHQPRIYLFVSDLECNVFSDLACVH